MKYIASCSFGKDSLATVILAKEHGEPLDEIVYCEVMFDDHISGEIPEHRRFICDVAVPKLDSWGIKTVVLRSKNTYVSSFKREIKSGKNAGQFRYGMNTNFGNALVFGTLQAKEPVSFPELGGEYMIVRKVKERYTHHTRTVTTTDSKGNTKRKTEVYYTWDYVGYEEKRSDNVSFFGEEFDIRQFNLPHEEAISLPNGGKYLYEWTVTRYYYEGLPSSFDATIHANLIKKDIGEGVDVFRDMTPDQVVESKLNGQNIPVISFWVLWLIFTGAVVYFFVGQENKWLEDGR